MVETSASNEQDAAAETTHGVGAAASRMWLQVSAVERSSTASLSSQPDFIDVRQLYTQVGSYRGQLVAVRRVNRKSVDLTRAVRKELKLVSTIVTRNALYVTL